MGDFHSVHMVCGFPFAAGSGIIAISGRETHAGSDFQRISAPCAARHGLTQEQLAEALGNDARGRCINGRPGCHSRSWRSSWSWRTCFRYPWTCSLDMSFETTTEKASERLKQYVHDRDPVHGSDPVDAISDVEKALQRYPNCFEIVYRSARIYRVKGLYLKNPAYSERAISLFLH